MEFGDITALGSLLKDCENIAAPHTESLPNSSLQSTKVVLPPTENENLRNDKDKVDKTKNDKAIWDDAEILSEDALVDLDDKRPIAKFEILYKHDNVGAEDTFLGLNGKSIASSDSTHLVLRIYFPKSRMGDIDLDCTKNRVKASSKYHHMFTYLPAPVNHLKGNAKFDPKTFILTVTLPIIEDD